MQSRYARIKQLELRITMDEMPMKDTFFHSLADWKARFKDRMNEMIKLKYFIIHDYEDLMKSEEKSYIISEKDIEIIEKFTAESVRYDEAENIFKILRKIKHDNR